MHRRCMPHRSCAEILSHTAAAMPCIGKEYVVKYMYENYILIGVH